MTTIDQPLASGLHVDDVHVWSCSLACDHEAIGDPTVHLDADERARAGRFRFAPDAERFMRGRAFLRHVLASYTGLAPAALRFVTNEQGKPSLHDAEARALWFNLSHSGPHALLAVARTRLLGVDVEVVRPGFADDEIAERFFAPSEVRALRRLPVSEQEFGFFRCWTRKEAYIKARGGGLQIPLDSFTVEFDRGAPAALTWVADQPGEPAEWTVRDISEAVPGCVAAFAARRPPAQLRAPISMQLEAAS
jgi:4'-phosphopantetheinyl transferase